MTTTDNPTTTTCPSWCDKRYVDVAGVANHLGPQVGLLGGGWVQA